MFKEVPASNKSKGQRKMAFGIGTNDADYVTHSPDGKKCPFYTRWSSMIQRCYSEKFLRNKPTYKGCTVCDEWLVFSNFKAWMEKMDWEGKDLDKDILQKGNKVYSPETCAFVSREVNSAMCFKKSKKSNLYVGITPEGSKFRVRCYVDGKRAYLGLFNSESEAEEAYKEAKIKDIKRLAKHEAEPIRSAMLRFICD